MLLNLEKNWVCKKLEVYISKYMEYKIKLKKKKKHAEIECDGKKK